MKKTTLNKNRSRISQRASAREAEIWEDLSVNLGTSSKLMLSFPDSTVFYV